MSKWKETNKYGIHESKAAYRHYTRRRDKEAEILKELEPNPPTHVDLTGLETYIQRLRESKEPTMDDNYLIWFDVETSGLDPMSDNLLEVEARITDMKGLQVPFADDHLIFHRVIRFDDNTPIRAFNSTTIDMHSRNGLISECMNAKDTLKNVDKQMAVWLIDTGLDPGLISGRNQRPLRYPMARREHAQHERHPPQAQPQAARPYQFPTLGTGSRRRPIRLRTRNHASHNRLPKPRHLRIRNHQQPARTVK